MVLGLGRLPRWSSSGCWKVNVAICAISIACHEGPTSSTPSAPRRFTPVDSLSASVGTLHINPGDPVIATVPAPDGEVVQYLAQKDTLGNPLRLMGLRKFGLRNQTASDLVVYDSNGLPSQVSLRDGRRLLFQSKPGGQVAMTGILATGESWSLSLTFPTSTSPVPVSPGRSSISASSVYQTATIVVYVTDDAGKPVASSCAGISGGCVSGEWTSGEGQGSLFWATGGNGVYDATVPLTQSSALDLLTMCNAIPPIVSKVCDAVQKSQILTYVAARCPELTSIRRFGPELAALCVAAVAVAELTCTIAPIQKLCTALTNAIDLFLPSLQKVTIHVTVSSFSCTQSVTQIFTPPFAGPLVISVVCPTPVASLMVIPATATLPRDETLQLTATSKDEAGSPLSSVVTWASSDITIATVSWGGSGQTVVVTPWTLGGVTITAMSEGLSGTAAVIVIPVPVASVTVTPTSATVQVGQTVQLTATALDAGGNILTGRPITWATSSPGVASVSGAGLVTGIAPGLSTITATSEGKTGNSSVTVPVPVASVSVNPATYTLSAGATVQLTATLKDASGNLLTGRTVTWSSSNPAAASVDGGGLVTGEEIGSATITATTEGKSGTAQITVIAPVAYVKVTPAAGEVVIGQTLQLTATTYDYLGNVLTGRPVTWTSSAPTVATVDDNGLVTGVAAGLINITATSEGKSATARVQAEYALNGTYSGTFSGSATSPDGTCQVTFSGVLNIDIGTFSNLAYPLQWIIAIPNPHPYPCGALPVGWWWEGASTIPSSIRADSQPNQSLPACGSPLMTLDAALNGEISGTATLTFNDCSPPAGQASFSFPFTLQRVGPSPYFGGAPPVKSGHPD